MRFTENFKQNTENLFIPTTSLFFLNTNISLEIIWLMKNQKYYLDLKTADIFLLINIYNYR